MLLSETDFYVIRKLKYFLLCNLTYKYLMMNFESLDAFTY